MSGDFIFSTNDFAILATFSSGVFDLLFEKFSILYDATVNLSSTGVI